MGIKIYNMTGMSNDPVYYFAIDFYYRNTYKSKRIYALDLHIFKKVYEVLLYV